MTVGVAVFPPETIPGPTHENVTPAVEEDPLRTTLGFVQVITCGPPAFTFGIPTSFVTFTVEVEVHPFTGFVTVSV